MVAFLNPLEWWQARFGNPEGSETSTASPPPEGPQTAFAVIAVVAALFFIGSLR